jgi:drug/metabolite transporter (DMT)-like permease
MNSTAQYRSRIATVVLVGVAVWFGFQTWLMQSGVRASSPLAFNAERFGLAALCMAIICLLSRVRLSRRAVIGGLWIGLVIMIGMACQSQALVSDPAGRASFLGSTYVALMPFLGLIFRREKLTVATVSGSGIMLLGAWWLFYVPGGSVICDAFAVTRAISVAAYILVLARFAHEDWRVVCLVEFVVVSLLSAGLAVGVGQAQFSLSPEVLIPVAACGLIGSAVCATGQIWSQRYLSAPVVGVLSFAEAVFALAWGVVANMQTLSWTSLGACITILIGAMLVLTAGSFPWHSLRPTAQRFICPAVSEHEEPTARASGIARR